MLKNARIEIHEGPDRHGRYSYTLYWLADYHPGHPDGEYRTVERGQCFFGNPDRHRVPAGRTHHAERYAGRNSLPE